MARYKIGSKEVFREACDDEMRATVYFPVDCKYGCRFCTSKCLYARYGTDPERVLRVVEAIGRSGITVVTITGGEPFADTDMLSRMLDRLEGKHVYVNSTMMAASVPAAKDILLSYKNIDGISVSRHTGSWGEDVKLMLADGYRRHEPLATDEDLVGLGARSLRVNAVLHGGSDSPELLGAVVGRWERCHESCPAVGVSFREDYNRITLENLHSLDTPALTALTSEELGLEFVGQSDCHVCDNVLFRTRGGMDVRYHRGLANTRLRLGSLVEIESLVLFPDGLLATDWDRTTDGLEEYCEQAGLKFLAENRTKEKK